MFSFCALIASSVLAANDVQNSRAKKNDYGSSLRGLRRPLGEGLGPPKPKPSYALAE